MSDFSDQLAKILGPLPKEAPQTLFPNSVSDDGEDVVAAPPLEDEPEKPAVDPYGVLIVREVDPFAAVIDQLVPIDAVPVSVVTTSKEHNWVPSGSVQFSGELNKFQCSKCIRWLSVRGDQTMDDAVVSQGVSPDCSEEILGAVMTA